MKCETDKWGGGGGGGVRERKQGERCRGERGDGKRERDQIKNKIIK